MKIQKSINDLGEKCLATELVSLEKKFGGYTSKVKRLRVSPFDPRCKKENNNGGMSGGDRMSKDKGCHNYSPIYAKYLKDVNFLKDLVVAEIGILKGTGLGIWSVLFPNSRIIGLDVDLSYTLNNFQNLKNAGANTEKIELHEFDQFVDNSKKLSTLLNGEKLNIVIDDGFHSIESITNTFKNAYPHLSKDFIYFIEDNSKVDNYILKEFPNLYVKKYDRLTVCKPLS